MYIMLSVEFIFNLVHFVFNLFFSQLITQNLSVGTKIVWKNLTFDHNFLQILSILHNPENSHTDTFLLALDRVVVQMHTDLFPFYDGSIVDCRPTAAGLFTIFPFFKYDG